MGSPSRSRSEVGEITVKGAKHCVGLRAEKKDCRRNVRPALGFIVSPSTPITKASTQANASLYRLSQSVIRENSLPAK